MKRKTVAQLIAELQAFPPGDFVVIADSVGQYEMPKVVRLGFDIVESGIIGRTLHKAENTVVLGWGAWGYQTSDGMKA